MKLLISLFVISLLLGLSYFFLGGKEMMHRYFPFDKQATSTKPITLGEKPAKCKPGDQLCIKRNERIEIEQLSGMSVAYTKHQCDSPRGCDEPDEKTLSDAVAAIKTLAKNSKLVLIRITGINPAGLVYFCATGDLCWSYDVKTKKAVKVMTAADDEISPASSRSGNIK